MDSARDERHRYGEATELLRKRGNRITPQRRAILEIIQEQGGHLSADEIYQLARARIPGLSLSTVYRTLDLLRELDLVSELHLASNRHHYEAPGPEHQHLVCLNCGRVVEFLCAHSAQTCQRLADQHGFSITGSRVELLGYCEECSKARNN